MPLSLTTVTGTLQSILGANVTNGTVTARLANFAGQPRVVGTNILATLVTTAISDSSGNFSLALVPNASIAPANTIYDFTFANADGQASGRLSFVVAGTTYDLDIASPVVVPPPETAPCACVQFGTDPTKYLDNTGNFTAPGVTSVALTAPAEFAVSGSPITGSGTLAITKANATPNTVWAGPASGGAAQPSFRALVATDLPISNIISRGGTVPSPQTGNYAVWRAPYACTVTKVWGWALGATGSTVNARKNQTSNHLASNLTLSSTGAWLDGGTVQNATYSAGDALEIMIPAIAGSPTLIAVQVDFTVP